MLVQAPARGGRISSWLPVLVVACVIFWGSTQTVSLPFTGLASLLVGAAAHAGQYLALGATLRRALGREGWTSVVAGWAAFVISVLYGVTDEIHQVFVPGRVGSPRDLIPDAIGAAAGVLIASYLSRRFSNASD